MGTLSPSTIASRRLTLAQPAVSRQQVNVHASHYQATPIKHRIATSPIPQRVLTSNPASKSGRRRSAVLAAAAAGEALVVGSSGQTAARVVYTLLRSGFKVTAGVDTDIEESREVVNFAKQLEILDAPEAGNLKLAEFNPLDADDVGAVIKRGARVVLVVGDQAGDRRPDMRVYDAVLGALLENADKIGQLVVVTTLGGGGGGGFFGGGRSGSAPGRLSALEQRVTAAGVPYVLVRASPSDRVTDRYVQEAGLVVEGFGNLPTGLSASRAQVAAVVASAMAQARSSAIIEVGASPSAPSGDLSSQVAEALAAGQQEEQEREEQPAKGAPARRSIGGRKSAAAEDDEEEEAPAPAKKPAFSFFGGSGGTRKIVRQPAPAAVKEEEKQEEEAPAPAKKPAFAFFGGSSGTRKVVRQPAPAAVEEEEEEAPAKPARRGFSFGTVRVGKAQKAAADEQEEAAAPADRAGTARFSAVSGRRVQQAAAEEPAAPATKRIIRGRKPLAPEPEKPAPSRPARDVQPADEEAVGKKKSGGLLGMLGINQETVYADEA